MTETIHAKCLTCHRSETWTVKNNRIIFREVNLEGGARKLSVHPMLAAWRTLQQYRAEKIWRVIKPCAACGMPMAARQTRQVPMEWPLKIGEDTYFVGPDLNTGPNGPITDEALDALLMEAYRERFDAKKLVSPTTYFQMMVLSIFAVVFFAWLTSAFCLSQFYIGMFSRGFAPSP